MQKKLKPFDLEAALNGAAVVTRDGEKVTEVVILKNKYHGKNVFALINSTLYWFNQDGRIYEAVECSNDLFMKPQQVTKWVNIYSTKSGYLTCGGGLFDTKEEALEGLGGSIDTIQITFEL
jgi:hypothetical protein